ncbi:beta-lactamase/transpeptidase-like protein [Podospora fimiseda]|uniref:Beta-lactamase/transpeptidase-like protein n=1 Tax=Podospora fimiseda TaxID=252190 RepID=A0AAN7BZ29_9PEZI|nr:beta-lactamase/transpeptidase-like protein [Podospora fimiseda]
MADKLNSILQSHVAQEDNTTDKLLGASFILVNKNNTLFAGSSGRINQPYAASAPFTTTSFAWVASLTKLLTSISLLQLVERNLLTLDGDLRPLIPEFNTVQILRGFNDSNSPILEPNTSPLTLRHLLTHTSGYGYDMMHPNLTLWCRSTGHNQHAMSRAGWDTPLVFSPGREAGWAYGTGIDWAGIVLEEITGQTLGEYFREHLFKPLGIKDSTFKSKEITQELEKRKVKLSFRTEEKELEVGDVPIPVEAFEKESGGAGLWTTAEEYSRVLKAVLNGEILGKELMDEMFKRQLNEEQQVTLKKTLAENGMAPDYEGVEEDVEENFGLAGALNLKDLPGRRKGGSLMWSGMCNSHWWIDRESGIAGVLVVAVMPFGDSVVNKLYRELESVVYDEFVSIC